MLHKILLFATLLFSVPALAQRAELRLVNTSERTLAIKVIQQTDTGGVLHASLTIPPLGRTTEYFSQTGHFFLKTKAELQGRETVYTKGNPFKVYVGSDGYSVLTVTYSITESNTASPLEGQRISKSEFDRDD
ncbi:MAG: hypothetical protein EP344_14810 [Bacteroidetes bacterium]|nr:MAG: hypothetical protein EP344_14810 [Bacteroidota bacterium]